MITDEIDALIKDADKPYKICSTKYILDQFTGEDRQALIKLIDGGVVPSGKIVELLGRHGHSITADLINKHRRRLAPTGGGCSCAVEL